MLNGTLGVHTLRDRACRGALLGRKDPERIAWGSLGAFPFIIQEGHSHLLG